MSYTEYLRTKQAGQPKVASIRKPTDASCYTQKTRMAAARTFFVDGTSVGTLVKQTDRPVFNNAAISSKKASGKAVAASDYTTYAGSLPSLLDLYYQSRRGTEKKDLPCVTLPPTPVDPNTCKLWKPYSSASDYMRSVKRVNNETGVLDSPGAPLFVDNTISLSAMHPKMVGVDVCHESSIVAPNHEHSPGIGTDINNQPYAVGKSFYMKSPPEPEGPNVSPHKVGGYLGPRTKYVENKHGFVKPTGPVPVAPGQQGQEIAHLKINKPNFGNIKPS